MKTGHREKVWWRGGWMGLFWLSGLLALAGGFGLSQLFSQVQDSTARLGSQLFEVEEHLDEAAIELGRQIQEWKNLLLRADNPELSDKHREAFKEASISVQNALSEAKLMMQVIGMDTSEIDELIRRHKLLLSEYLQAYAGFSAKDENSIRQVDRQVIGVDRELQQRMLSVKAAIVNFAREQLSQPAGAQENRPVLVGLLGAVSLFSMAVLGYAYARRPSR